MSKHKRALGDFSRQHSKNSKGLTFSNTARLILSGLRCSYKAEVTNFFNENLMLPAKEVPSDAAFCLARQKVKHSVFIDLNHSLLSDFYNSCDWKSWHDFRLVAIDGSTAHVFDSDENAEFFKGWVAQNGNGEICPKARLSLAYDPLNMLVVDAQMSPTSTGEEKLAELHIAESSPQDLNIFDRGYFSYRLMMEHERLGLHYCVRVPVEKSTKLLEGFMDSDKEDVVVDYMPSAPITWKYKKQGGEAVPAKVRLVKITLDTGEVEVLATNVFSVCGKSAFF